MLWFIFPFCGSFLPCQIFSLVALATYVSAPNQSASEKKTKLLNSFFQKTPDWSLCSFIPVCAAGSVTWESSLRLYWLFPFLLIFFFLFHFVPTPLFGWISFFSDSFLKERMEGKMPCRLYIWICLYSYSHLWMIIWDWKLFCFITEGGWPIIF